MAQFEKSLQDAANGVDQRLFKLSAQIDSLTSHLSLDKDSTEFLAEFQRRNFEAFSKDGPAKPLDPEVLGRISTLPPRQFPLAERLATYRCQQEYIDSLNLREVAHASFATINSCIQSIARHLDPDEPLPDDVNNYQLLSDLSQQRDFMFSFNHYFKRVVNHIIELSSFLQRKEQSYIEQIESLSKQN